MVTLSGKVETNTVKSRVKSIISNKLKVWNCRCVISPEGMARILSDYGITIPLAEMISILDEYAAEGILERSLRDDNQPYYTYTNIAE